MENCLTKKSKSNLECSIEISHVFEDLDEFGVITFAINLLLGELFDSKEPLEVGSVSPHEICVHSGTVEALAWA